MNIHLLYVQHLLCWSYKVYICCYRLVVFHHHGHVCFSEILLAVLDRVLPNINPQNVTLQATKFGGNDQAITLWFSYLLNKVNDASLPYFHYFFLMFHYCSYLISVLASLQNYSSLFVVRLLPWTLVVSPIRMIVTLSMERVYRRIVPNSKIKRKPVILMKQNFVAFIIFLLLI